AVKLRSDRQDGLRSTRIGIGGSHLESSSQVSGRRPCARSNASSSRWKEFRHHATGSVGGCWSLRDTTSSLSSPKPPTTIRREPRSVQGLRSTIVAARRRGENCTQRSDAEGGLEGSHPTDECRGPRSTKPSKTVRAK